MGGSSDGMRSVGVNVNGLWSMFVCENVWECVADAWSIGRAV